MTVAATRVKVACNDYYTYVSAFMMIGDSSRSPFAWVGDRNQLPPYFQRLENGSFFNSRKSRILALPGKICYAVVTPPSYRPGASPFLTSIDTVAIQYPEQGFTPVGIAPPCM